MANSTALTPEQRSLRASIASHISWANTPDPSARTAPARAAALGRFEKQVREEASARGETLAPHEIRRRAEHLRKAHFARMALASARARRKGGSG
jgi:hypothetical protein